MWKLLIVLLFVSCTDCDKLDSTPVEVTMKIYMVNGMEKVITVNVPKYTSFGVYSTGGGYRLSYWVCDGGLRHEKIVKQGVVDFEIIK